MKHFLMLLLFVCMNTQYINPSQPQSSSAITFLTPELPAGNKSTRIDCFSNPASPAKTFYATADGKVIVSRIFFTFNSDDLKKENPTEYPVKEMYFIYQSKSYGPQPIEPFTFDEYELRLNPKVIREKQDVFIGKNNPNELYAIVTERAFAQKAVAIAAQIQRAQQAKQQAEQDAKLRAQKEAEAKREAEEKARVEALLLQSPNPRRLAEFFLYRFKENPEQYKNLAEKEPLKFLGLAHSASEKEIDSNVKSLAKMWHGDLWINDANQAIAEEIIKLIGIAATQAKSQASDQ